MPKYNPLRGIRLHGRTYQLRMMIDGHPETWDLGTDDVIQAQVEADKIRANPIRDSARAWEVEVDSYVVNRTKLGKFNGKTPKETKRVVMKYREWCGHDTPDTVRVQDVQLWYDELEDDLDSQYSAHTYVARVTGFLGWLSGKKRTRYDRFKRLEMTAIDANALSRKDYAKPEQVQRLITNCPRQDLKFVLYAGFEGGMRRGEISQATPQWFNLEKGYIEIPAIQTIDGRTWRPKNRKGRIVPLMPQFREFLEKEFVWTKDQKFMLHPEAHGQLYRWDPRRPFEEYIEAQGMDWMMHHTMRHTFTTLALEAGYSMEKVASWIGDKIKTVEKHYSHIRPRLNEISIDPFSESPERTTATKGKKANPPIRRDPQANSLRSSRRSATR